MQPLDCSDFNSGISLVHLATRQLIARASGLKFSYCTLLGGGQKDVKLQKREGTIVERKGEEASSSLQTIAAAKEISMNAAIL